MKIYLRLSGHIMSHFWVVGPSFHMLKERDGQKCNISDLNSDLILAYDVIQNNIDDLIYSLKNHEKNYQKDSKSYYYRIRESNS